MKIVVSDEQLACLAQMGDQKAVELLLNKYKPLVRKTCQRYYIAGSTTEDVLQEGMIGLYRAIMSFKLEKNDSFHAFASMCIKRRLATTLTSANRKKNLPLNTCISLNKPIGEEGYTLGDVIEDKGVDPEHLFLNEEKRFSARKRLAGMLSPFEKQILREYLKEKSYDEIADKLDVSTKSVDNAMQRIRSKLSRIKV